MSLLARRVNRINERINEALGKTAPTVDDLYSQHVNKFRNEEAVLQQYRKELKNYTQRLHDLEVAFNGLMDSMIGIHEKALGDGGAFSQSAKAMILYHDNLAEVITEKSQANIANRLQEFADLRIKIDKREKKRLNYDAARHTLDTMVSAKKRDEAREVKAKEDFERQKGRFEELNNHLHDRLPSFHDDRLRFYAENMYDVLAAHKDFYGRIRDELTSPLQQLSIMNSNYEKVRSQSPPLPPSQSSPLAVAVSSSPQSASNAPLSPSDENNPFLNDDDELEDDNPFKEDLAEEQEMKRKSVAATGPVLFRATSGPSEKSEEPPPAVKPEECMAKYDHDAEDDDELNFKKNQLIRLLSFDQDDDQDEGWMKGRNVESGEVGFFPLNYTDYSSRLNQASNNGVAERPDTPPPPYHPPEYENS